MAGNLVPTNIMDVADYVQKQGEAGRLQGVQQKFSQLASQAYTAPAGEQRTALMGQAVGVDPKSGLELGTQLAANDKATASAQDEQMKRVAGAAGMVVEASKAGNMAQAQGAYRAAFPALSRLAASHGKVAPADFTPDMLPGLYQLMAAAGGKSEQKGVVINGSLVNSATGETMASVPYPLGYQNAIPNGTGTAAGFANRNTGTIAPANVSGGQPQPQPPTQTEITPSSPVNTDAVDQANQLLNQGMPIQQIMQEVIRKNPYKQFSVIRDPATGQIRIKDVSDGSAKFAPAPQASDGMGEVQGQPQAAPQAAQGQFGVGVAKPSASSDLIGSRITQFDQLVSQGAIDPKSPDFAQQRSQYLTTGKTEGMGGMEGNGSVKPLGDISKSGADYLSTVPSSERGMMNGLLNGTIPMPTGSALKSPLWQSLMAGAKQADPSWNVGAYKQYADTRKYFTTGKGGATINNISTAMGHADEMLDTVNTLDNNGMRPIAAGENYLSQMTGKTPVTNFESVRTALASEMAAAYKNGNAPTDQETNHWRDQITANMSRKQQTDVLRHWVDLLSGKMNAVQSQYRSGMSNMSDPLTVVSSDARDAMTRINAFADKFSGNTGSHPKINDAPIYAPGQQAPQQASAQQPASGGWSIQKVN